MPREILNTTKAEAVEIDKLSVATGVDLGRAHFGAWRRGALRALRGAAPTSNPYVGNDLSLVGGGRTLTNGRRGFARCWHEGYAAMVAWRAKG